MTKKKKIIRVLLIFVTCVILASIFEIGVFNRNILFNKQYTSKLKITDLNNVELKDGYYVTTDDDAYIIFEGQDKYVNKLSFDYIADSDFTWDYQVKSDTYQLSQSNSVSRIINTTVRKVRVDNPSTIKISFHNKNLKVNNFKISNRLSISYERVLLMTFTIFLLIILVKYFSYFKNNIDKTFVLIGFLMGITMTLLTPIHLVTSSDDQVHFHKAYTILDGTKSKWSYSGRYFNHLVIGGHGNYRSNEEIRLYKKFLIKNDTKKSTIKLENQDSNLDYNELIYLPFSFGYKIARLFGFNFVNSLYVSKLFNLIFYLAIMFFAIRISPYFKKLIFIIGLLPANIYLASQFSYDSTITAGVMISIASLLKIKSKKKVDLKYLLIFILGIIWASLPKVIYAPLLLLFLLIPNDWFANRKQARIVKIGICILSLVLMSIFVIPVLTSTASGDSRVANTSVSLQLKYILMHPINYIKLLLKETIYNFDNMFFGFDTFSLMGYLNRNTHIFDLSNFVLLVLILYVTFTDTVEESFLDKKFKIALAILLVMIWCLIWTALYLQWTPVGHNSIEGVQSRYFLPLLFPLLILFVPYGKKKKVDVKHYIYIIPLLILAYSSIFLAMSYFG